MPSQPDSLEQLRMRLAAFAAERQWDQFHSPKEPEHGAHRRMRRTYRTFSVDE